MCSWYFSSYSLKACAQGHAKFCLLLMPSLSSCGLDRMMQEHRFVVCGLVGILVEALRCFSPNKWPIWSVLYDRYTSEQLASQNLGTFRLIWILGTRPIYRLCQAWWFFNRLVALGKCNCPSWAAALKLAAGCSSKSTYLLKAFCSGGSELVTRRVVHVGVVNKQVGQNISLETTIA